MSTSPVVAVEAAPVDDLTPVEIPVASLESLAPAHLRDLKADLAADGKVPAVVSASCCCDAESTLATHSAVDDLRECVRAAAFLGASRLDVHVEEAADPATAESALAACAERAHREGVQLSVHGAVEFEADAADAVVAPGRDG